MAKTIAFKYKNHRGEVAVRTVSVDSLEYLPEPGFGYEPGYFLTGYCYDKKARRSFALCNIVREDEPGQLTLGRFQLIKFYKN